MEYALVEEVVDSIVVDDRDDDLSERVDPATAVGIATGSDDDEEIANVLVVPSKPVEGGGCPPDDTIEGMVVCPPLVVSDSASAKTSSEVIRERNRGELSNTDSIILFDRTSRNPK